MSPFSSIPPSKPKKKTGSKERLIDKVKRRKRHSQITVVQSLASSAATKKDSTSEADIFRHTHQMGESHGIPHSIKDQVQQGQSNAHVTGHDSYKEATDHSRDHTFKHLSTNFGLNG